MTSPPPAPPPAGETRTALERIAECIGRIRMTDPADTAAALLAAWHGFGTAHAAGRLLAQDNLEDAVLARNARPVQHAVAERLHAAPSLPYTVPVPEIVDAVEGLVPDGFGSTDATAEAATAQIVAPTTEPDAELDDSPAGAVRRGILALALELNALLPHAAEHAQDPADAQACRDATRLAYELSRCWEGRLDSFLNATRRDL